MWTNLLTGTIGAIVGAAGVFAAALITISRTSRNDKNRADDRRRDDAQLATDARDHVAAQSRLAETIGVSGKLAYRLVEFYDNLRDATAHNPSDEQSVELKGLRASAGELRRAITVDGPLLSPELEHEMQGTRDEIRRVFGRDRTHATGRDLIVLLKMVHESGDRLRRLRRELYDEAPPGSRLGEYVKG